MAKKIKKGCFHLPEELLIEILVKLSVKSLLRLQTVCKSWYALIKNPSFVSKHLNYVSSFDNDDNARIAIKYCNRNWSRKSISPITKAFISFLSNEGFHLYPNDRPSPFIKRNAGENDMKIYGSCNGIICAVAFRGYNCRHGGDVINLWNPATKEIKHICVPNLHKRNQTLSVLTIGFGFDTRSNEYKVIRIIDSEPQRLIGDPVVEVYHSSTDSWGTLDAVLLKKLNSCADFSTYLNGFCYWMAEDDDDGHFVLSFDFANDLFDKICLPPHINIRNGGRTPILKFNGTIAISADDSKVKDCIAIWVLNMSNGEKKTWTKLYRIPFYSVHVVGFLRGGEILMLSVYDDDDSVSLKSYDPCTQQLNNLQVYDLTPIESYQMVEYVESLVSFKESYKLQK